MVNSDRGQELIVETSIALRNIKTDTPISPDRRKLLECEEQRQRNGGLIYKRVQAV